MIVSREASPYTENSSPKAVPRDFWSSRDPMSPARFDENTPERSPSPSLLSPKRRASIEKLKQAGRVKTSNIFALETKDAYDPAHAPVVERPTANRPLSHQLANNSFTRFDSLRKENNPLRSPQTLGHKRPTTQTDLPTLTPTKSPSAGTLQAASSQRQESPSPTKSSLARNSKFSSASFTQFDPENSTWSNEEREVPPRGLHRHAKSVTFQADPPVVTEYEQQTPEPSLSVASDREGSWDSDDYYDQDVSFERGSSAEIEREDSFDADLENTDKTPVVLPEDWSRMSPNEARTDLVDDEDDVFDSPTQRPVLGRSESVASDGETRPLPPLPGFMTGNKHRQSDSLTVVAERVSYAQRNPPSPPKRASCSKDEILKMMRESTLSARDRLHMTAAQDVERPASQTSEETAHGEPEEFVVKNLDTGEKLEVMVRVAESEIQDESVIDELADFAAPQHISRESILRKVRNTKYDFEDEDELDESELGNDSPGRPSIAELARMGPDEPIPSRETSRETSEMYKEKYAPAIPAVVNDVPIKEEPMDEQAISMASIPAIGDLYIPHPTHDDYDRQSSVLRHNVRSESADEDDARSHCSDISSIGPEAESTLLHAQPTASEPEDGKEPLHDAMQLLSVKDYSHMSANPELTKNLEGDFMGLPTFFSSGGYDFGMTQYMTPSPPVSTETTQVIDVADARSLSPLVDLPKPQDVAHTPYVEREVSPPGTPDSVLHRDSDVSGISSLRESEATPPPPTEIPERRATIKTGGKLKARPSATPADMFMMAQQRRLVSAEHIVPPMPQAYQADFEGGDETTEVGSIHPAEGENSKADPVVRDLDMSVAEDVSSHTLRESTLLDLTLDIPALGSDDVDGLGMDAEFDRVIEGQKVGSSIPLAKFVHFCHRNQENHTNEHPSHYLPEPYTPLTICADADIYLRTQKGYLTRQNNKVVVASSRDFSGESTSTANDAPLMSPTAETANSARPGTRGNVRKGSAEQYLKTEPWIGQSRRKSVRAASAQKNALHTREPAPPLPGQESALGTVPEGHATAPSDLEEHVPEGTERGRLFVKVVGVKHLDLPIPRNDRLSFQLTLDNGLHCVTTSNLELGKTASIGQEFELVVLDDLEFQLTLTTKLPPPPKRDISTPPSPTKSLRSQKAGAFSRFLSSPRKRAEKERKAREDEEIEERKSQEAAQRKRASIQPSAWDLLHELVNSADGSFARAYVNLKSHETQCYGRQLTVDVPCYNEWALENDAHVMDSVRSKRGANTGPIRRPPYVVGHLELQLLYVPKPRAATDETMPKSMGSAVREMGRAREVKEVVHESHLSQQGGDCTVSSVVVFPPAHVKANNEQQHWRRRFFRLQGPQLTAYHEQTHQKRAVINLAKASRLVDDKRMLVADPASSPSKSSRKRRKSAFAEEDEGYQYVEEGFRIRFSNGETIDFYADSIAEKEAWMEVLAQVIGKPAAADPHKGQRWTDMVLGREKLMGVPPAPLPKDGTEAKEFTKPAPPLPLTRQTSDRKAIAKSAPNSPVKMAPPSHRAPAPPMASARPRPRTPPMSERRGHRTRDAVKSMIF